jgi:hypothetical protein
MNITYHRTGNLTQVYRDGYYLGTITRRDESNSSPRGGAYRSMHYTKGLDSVGRPVGRVAHYSRREAVEYLLSLPTR